jgi:hypothetical protein
MKDQKITQHEVRKFRPDLSPPDPPPLPSFAHASTMLNNGTQPQQFSGRGQSDSLIGEQNWSGPVLSVHRKPIV